MSGLDNRAWVGGEDTEETQESGLSKLWREHKGLCIGLIIGLVAAVIIIVIIVVLRSRRQEAKGDENAGKASGDSADKEGFISVNDMTENGFVNSYINSSIGGLVE